MKVSLSLSLALIFFSSMINISSIANIWAIIGQMQLMFFLILARAYIPKDIIDFITSSNYILSLLNFIPLNQAKGALSWLDWIEYSQPDDLLDKVGIESGSTYINNVSLF